MKIFTLLIFTLFSLCTASASAEPRLVSLQKGDKYIDLFGTIHIAKPRFYPLPNRIIKKINQADIVTLEMDITNPEITTTIMHIMVTHGRNADQNIKTILNEQQIKQFNQLLGPAAIGMQKLKPGLLAINLQMIVAQNFGFTAEAVDTRISTIAHDSGIELVGLESPEEQMAVLLSIPNEEGITLLKQVLNKDRILDDLHDMESLWLDSDADRADKILQEMQSETPHFYQTALMDRNRTMADRILAVNQNNQRVFVAIGAGHLYGKGNVIELLIKAGYRQINADNQE